MAYKNILWIKLEKRLLNDYRFYTLSEEAQLIYLKLLMLSAETNNKIPKNSLILQSCFRTKLNPESIEKCIQEIQEHFPKLRNKQDFYYFKDWDYKHNWIAGELPSNSSATPQELVDKIRIDKIRIDKIRKDKSNKISPSDLNLSQFLYDLIKKRNPEWYLKPNLNEWADEIRKLREIDKQPIEVITKVIQWCQEDDFWAKNILSTSKLRKQFPTLLVQMNNKKKQPFYKGNPMRKHFGTWEVLVQGEWKQFTGSEKDITYQ